MTSNAIQFSMNENKALQTLLWILNRKPGIDIYNIMKVVFAAECYHLNKYGRPIYGDSYEAWRFGTVPAFMRKLTNITKNVPYFSPDNSKNGLATNAIPNMDEFSQTDLEALEYGMKEYGDLSFDDAIKKNHAVPAWKKYEARVKSKEQHIPILYEDFITDKEVAAYLQDVGYAMVL
jgi:uncharacterized phage-associated protein